ncbi:hypothetical protein HK405_009833, partial [Cladochytrium tenue]
VTWTSVRSRCGMPWQFVLPPPPRRVVTPLSPTTPTRTPLTQASTSPKTTQLHTYLFSPPPSVTLTYLSPSRTTVPCCKAAGRLCWTSTTLPSSRRATHSTRAPCTYRSWPPIRPCSTQSTLTPAPLAAATRLLRSPIWNRSVRASRLAPPLGSRPSLS